MLALISVYYFESSCPILLKQLFDIVLGNDRDPFICPSTESDMISNISESASPASFKASTLSWYLVVRNFEIRTFSNGFGLMRNWKKERAEIININGYEKTTIQSKYTRIVTVETGCPTLYITETTNLAEAKLHVVQILFNQLIYKQINLTKE